MIRQDSGPFRRWRWVVAMGLLLGGHIRAFSTPATNTVVELFRDLGAADCATRDQAEEKLRALVSSVREFLQPYQNSRDPEIRFRIRRLLRSIPPEVRRFLERKSRITGEARERDSIWPCIVQVAEFDPATDTFRGTVEWTNLNALHAIEGRWADDRLEFRETKILRPGNAILGCVYTYVATNASGGELRGRWTDPKSHRGGDTKLTLTELPPSP